MRDWHIVLIMLAAAILCFAGGFALGRWDRSHPQHIIIRFE